MNEKSLRILEYNKIIEMLESNTSSELGRAMCRELMPMNDIDEIHAALNETADALSRIYRNGSLSLSGIKDIRMSVKSMEIGSTLSIEELLDISSVLSVAAHAKSYSRKTYDDTADNEGQIADSVQYLFDSLEPVTPLNNEIKRCILSVDEIADDASATLKSIRRQMRNTNDKIRNELNRMVSGSSRTYLQDAVVTTRGGRYCIPVKSEYRQMVPGMVHDQSSTGSTVFIEPMSVVKLNNDLRELELKEIEEINVILATLSREASMYSNEIITDVENLVKIDFVFAKGNLAKHLKCTQPEVNDKGIINIKKGRHPLIDAKKVVPIDVHMGDTFDQLIITGPNTGGKTVTLKTIGLFSLMVQAGLHIPAADGSKIAIFKDIYADIGDEQSIEQSLSTFSSHMTNIVKILNEADDHCLVLFDELCAGTDPTEGAALAISILTSLHKLKVTTIATTHYSELKLFALSTNGIENACCEFDVESLAPTYRLLIGIPGKSNAFAISGKLGLPSYIIDDARALIGTNDQAFEDVIAELEKNRINLEQEQKAAEDYKKEVEDLKKQLEAKNVKLDERQDKIISDAKEQAAEILREAKEIADDTIRTMNKATAKGISVSELENERRKLREKMDNVSDLQKIKKAVTAKKHEPKDFHIGDRVRVLSLNLEGTVHTLPNTKGDLTVTMGILNSQVNISDLEIIQESIADTINNKKTSMGKMKMSKRASISPEINLIGMTSDEAISALDKYLDDACISHLNSVRIVHGKGSGILRNAVHNHLKRLKYIKEFHLGAYGEGDSGVTIAEFK